MIPVISLIGTKKIGHLCDSSNIFGCRMTGSIYLSSKEPESIEKLLKNLKKLGYPVEPVKFRCVN
jgi:hypothetical protein